MEQDNTPESGVVEAAHAIPARERWRSIISQQAQSGLGVAAFCRQWSIPTSSFFGWRAKLLRGGESPAGFVAVKLAGGPPAIKDRAALEVRLRGGRRLLVRRGFDRQLLQEVVAALEGMSPAPEAKA